MLLVDDDEPIEDALSRLNGALLPSFEIGGLFTRNVVAHKWKATTGSLLLREAVFWRLVISMFEHEYNDVWSERFEARTVVGRQRRGA
jgi:hypothetical protein